MEKDMHTEAAVQDLLETKDFDALTAAERALVEGCMTQEEYRRRRRILTESAGLKAGISPRPLVLPHAHKTRVIPLYQAVIGAAAAVLITFFALRLEHQDIPEEQARIVAVTDTVYQERLKVDTVFLVERVEEAKPGYMRNAGSGSLVELNQDPGNLNTIPLHQLDLENRGSAGVNEASISLVRNFNGVN